jgi:hypothetical protein
VLHWRAAHERSGLPVLTSPPSGRVRKTSRRRAHRSTSGGGEAARQRRLESGREHERAGERGEEVRWWPRSSSIYIGAEGGPGRQ